MKGLILADFYMAKKYCRSYFLIMLVFIAVSFFGNDNTFLIIYPVILAGMLPVTLLGYGERHKWNVYCETLPLTRRQVVTEKYLLPGILLLGVFLLIAVVQGLRLSASGQFDVREYGALLAPLLAAGLLSPSITLPCMFKYGVEKGRIAYYVVVGMVCGVAAAQAGPYFLGRRQRGALAALTARHPRLEALELGRDPGRQVFLLRLAGVLPGDLVSLWLGAAGAPWRAYFAGGLLGSLPRVLAATALGAALWNPGGLRFWASWVFGWALTGAALLAWGREWARA